jgi:hypothetical protein
VASAITGTGLRSSAGATTSMHGCALSTSLPSDAGSWVTNPLQDKHLQGKAAQLLISILASGFLTVKQNYISRKEVSSIKLLEHKKYSIVTEVKEITISPLYVTEETFQRNIYIRTIYGETLDLVLYADQRNKLALTVPLEEEDLTFNP